MGQSFKFQINKMTESFLFDYDASHMHQIGEQFVIPKKFMTRN